MKPGKTYICLGRLGDQINLAPLLWADAQKGERPTLLVAKEYAGQLSEGCSYFDELIFDGPIDALKDAYNFARGFVEDADIVVAQIVGKPEDAKWAYSRINATHAQTDSFAKEAYLLAGRLLDWGKFPLVFDNRNKAREKELTFPWMLTNSSEKPKLMLVSADGKTSPFLHKKLLLENLEMKFPSFRIIDLVDVNTSRIYDLLAIYEQADVLVATDSAPLHLAYACPNLPVVALVNDKPILWNGSPWRPNHIAHIRYSDFRARILDIWEAIEGIGKVGSRFNPKLTQDTRFIHAWHSFELSDGKRQIAAGLWNFTYNEKWIECVATPGLFGRDSKTAKISEKRFPYLKDVIRIAARMARDDDKIVITRPETCPCPGISDKLSLPCYAHRRNSINNVISNDYDPNIDLIAFPKSWWRANHAQVPELIMNNDNQWATVLVELMKVTGGVTELKDAIYQV